MKFLTIFTLFLSLNAFAEADCTSTSFPNRTYHIRGSWEDARLIVKEKGKVIYEEQMIEEDWQGEFTYTGKRGYIHFPHPEEVTYSYPVLRNGTFVTKTLNLKCTEE